MDKFKGSSEAWHMCDSLRVNMNCQIDYIKQLEDRIKALEGVKEAKKNEPLKK